jgi:hypothetical protein
MGGDNEPVRACWSAAAEAVRVNSRNQEMRISANIL